MKNQGTAPPTVSQPTMPSDNQLFKLNRKYLFSLTGLLRLAIIIFQFAGWISAASVPKIINGQYVMPSAFADTRGAYLFFSIVGFVLAIVIFIMFFLNLVYAKFIDKIPWSITVRRLKLWVIKILFFFFLLLIHLYKLK